jgi:UDP-glucose 4-epimerase
MGENTKIVVTGAAGFIGSHITERLINDGHDVLGIDLLHTGSLKNLSGLNVNAISVYEMSGSIERICRIHNFKPEIIFHEGMWSSSPHYVENPNRTGKVIEQFINILQYATDVNARVVYASTSSMYNGLPTPHHEKQIPKITDFYTEARIAMERMAQLYFDRYGTESIGLRYFSVFGRREEAKGKCANLLSQFTWAMQQGRSPLIFGDGSQTRDFIHVSDVVEANILAMKSPKPHGVYNVGTGKSLSLNQAVAYINDLMGSNIIPEYRENRIRNYVQDTLASTEKAEKELAFTAKTTLKRGLLDIMS